MTGRRVGKRVLRLRVEVHLPHAVVHRGEQFLRGRSARAVEDVLKARAGVRPLEYLLTLGKNLRA
jgi:hypothetical protein